MKVLKALFTVNFTLFTPVLFGGPGHDHHHHGPPKVASCKVKVCTQDEIKLAATKKVIPSYITSKKLADTWTTASLKEIKKVSTKGTEEWRLVFSNSSEQDSKKQSLYLFLSTFGHLTGINHTGK